MALSQRKNAVETQGTRSIVATNAVETQVKGTVLLSPLSPLKVEWPPLGHMVISCIMRGAGKTAGRERQ